MGGLFGGGGNTTIKTSDPMLGAIRIQTSAYGQPIPLLWGRTRITANLIWYGDFQAVPHTTTTSSGGGGGKGGGGGQVTSSNTTYTYQAAVAMGLCEGAVSAIGDVWAGKDQTDMGTLGLTLFGGASGQSPWGYLSTNHSAQAVAYPQTAYVAGASYQLDGSASLPNHSFEVSGPLPYSGTIPDANPKDVITDYLCNVSYGAGFPTSVIGDLTQFSNYCVANSIFMSPALVAQQPAQQTLTAWAQLTNSQIVWSEGKFKLIPYGDQAATGNGVTFTPNVTPIYDLTDDDFLPGKGDPIEVTRSDPVDAFNQAQIEFCNRENQYNIEVAQAQDQNAVELFGLRPASVISFHDIVDPNVARTVAQMVLQRYQLVRNTYEFSLGWKYALLEPGDIVTLTDVYLGLNKFPVRITQIEEDETGTLAITAEEFPAGAATAALYSTQIVSPWTLSQSVAPGSANTPAIFTPPNSLTAPNTEVWIAASGGPYWGGCEVWASQDNATYRKLGVITNPARMGVLSSSIASGADPDTTHTLAVDLTQSRGQLTGGSQADADNLTTLCWVDGELISYQAATLTAQYKYNLGTYLRRGVKGTPITAHNAGAQFVRLDGAIFRYAVPAEWLGKPIYIKLPSFNIFGNALESLAAVAAYAYTLTGNKPAALTGLSATGGMFENDLAWTFASNQNDRFYTEIWGSTTNDRSTATQLTTALNPVNAWKHTGLQPGQVWYYWGRVSDTSKNLSDFYPAGSTSGIACAPSADPSALLTQLKNAVGMSQLASELSQPIVATPAAAQMNALAALQSALSDYDLTTRMQWQEAVTNATISTDPVTGKIQLLATANVTTDVEARLSAVEVEASADHASLTSTVSTLATVQGNLTTAQTQITQLQSTVSVGASQVYVDNSVANAVGTLNVTAAQANTNLAAAELQAALDIFSGQQTTQALTANVANALSTLQSHADAISAEAAARTSLVAVVAGNAAAIATEATARANADSSEAKARQQLETRMTTAEGNITTTAAAIASEASARTTSDTATASRIDTMTAAAAASGQNLGDHALRDALDQFNTSQATQALQASVATALSSISETADALSAEITSRSQLVATVAGTQASVILEQLARAAGDAASASSIATVQARLDSGDFAAVKTQSSATADALGNVQAEWGVQVQTMADGVRAAAGLKLLAGTDGETVFAVLADKLLIYKPDGTGTPKQIVTLGTINGLVALGLDGNLIIDGSIVARALAARSITADKIATGTLTANEIAANTLTADLIVSASATSFEMTQQSIPDSTWATYMFYMHHDGIVAIIAMVNFVFSSGGGTYTYEGKVGIDGTIWYTGQSGTYTNSSGPAGVSLQISGWLGAGWHTIKLYGQHSGATGSHLGYATIFKSYR